MALIKIPLEGKPGFYTFINPDFVTPIATTVGEEGGRLIFHLANREKAVTYEFGATNSANADKKAIDPIKKLFGTIKAVDDAPFQGLLSKSPPSTLL